MIGDKQPSRLTFPTIEVQDGVIELALEQPQEDLEGTIVSIGMDEPPIEQLWIKGDARKMYLEMLESCEELLIAGYPGCLGCGGPNSEEDWNEISRREKF